MGIECERTERERAAENCAAAFDLEFERQFVRLLARLGPTQTELFEQACATPEALQTAEQKAFILDVQAVFFELLEAGE